MVPLLVSAVAAGLLVVPGVTAAAAADPNVLPNSGFETAGSVPGCPAQWNCTASQTAATYRLDTANPYDGQRAVQLEVPNTRDRVVVQRWAQPASPYLTYRVSVRYRAEGVQRAGGYARVWFHKHDPDRPERLVNLGSKTVYGPTGTSGWVQLDLEAESPAATAFWTLDLGLFKSPGKVWFDAAHAEAYPGLRVYGDTRVVRDPGGGPDVLTLRLGAPTGTAVDQMTLFDTDYAFDTCTGMVAPDGRRVAVALAGQARCDAANRRFTLPASAESPGTFTLTPLGSGRFDVPAGRSYPPIFVREPGTASKPEYNRIVFVMAQGFGQTDYARVRQGAGNLLGAARKLDGFLETSRRDGPVWRIHHATFANLGARRDPHGISAIVSGYLRLYRVTGEAAYRSKAVAALNWFARTDVQLPDGSYGLPWEYDHGDAVHYPSGQTQHPANTPYAILTANVGNALVEGYKTLADEPGRERWLTAARRARDALFTGPNGFEYLGDGQQYGHVPYCVRRPIRAGDADGKSEVYNIDGATLAFYVAYSRLTGTDPYHDRAEAVARHLVRRINEDGSIAYADYGGGKPVGYATIVYGGLLAWAQFSNDANTAARVELARKGLSWGANVDGPLVLTAASYLNAFRLDATDDMIDNLGGVVIAQNDDGSYDPAATRTDGVRLAGLGGALLQIGYQPAPVGGG